jgi:hypothetical protein
MSYRTPFSKPTAQGCFVPIVAFLSLAAGATWIAKSA